MVADSGFPVSQGAPRRAPFLGYHAIGLPNGFSKMGQ